MSTIDFFIQDLQRKLSEKPVRSSTRASTLALDMWRIASARVNGGNARLRRVSCQSSKKTRLSLMRGKIHQILLIKCWIFWSDEFSTNLWKYAQYHTVLKGISLSFPSIVSKKLHDRQDCSTARRPSHCKEQ